MRALDIIIKKRNGETLSAQEIKFLIDEYVAGRVKDYQVAAWLMAVYFRGMDFEETAALTRAMLESGRTIDLTGLAGPFIDKHSTGGVGDKISLILAPLVAACGVKVPMLCGRGLGHTGGTVDKLEAIPGYCTALSRSEIKRVLGETGFVFLSQTEDIAPADKLLYALRDVTGTIESVPLITASILSKKAAEGSDGFVFDVKAGRGAFMKTEAAARALAESLVKTARVLGKKAQAVVTAMDEPLGKFIGNLAEVKETVSCLLGDMPEDLAEVTYRLGGRMLVLAGKARTPEEGADACRRALADRSAYRLFLANVAAQGGDPEAIARPERISLAPRRVAVEAGRGGYIFSWDSYKLGSAAVLAGAGRADKESAILPRVGIELLKKQGSPVAKGDALCLLHLEEDTQADEALALVRQAIDIRDKPPEAQTLILFEMDTV